MPQKQEPIPDFDAMTPSQRIRALDALWDSMQRHADSDGVPAWHDAVLREREAEYKSGKVKMIPLEDFKKAVRKARR